MNYYIADLHIGHENVIKHDGRPFKDVAQMANEIVRRWNSAVSNHDDVYILGDFAWKNPAGLEVLQQLTGRKYLILGNHDKPSQEMAVYFEWIRNIAVVKDSGTEVVLIGETNTVEQFIFMGISTIQKTTPHLNGIGRFAMNSKYRLRVIMLDV